MTLSLADLAPATVNVTVRGVETPVRAIALGDLAGLLLRFPQVRALLSGGIAEVSSLFGLASDAVAAILAMALGHGGDPEWEAALAMLPAEEQACVLEATVRLTAPSGLGPFAERLTTLISSGVGAAAGKPKTK